jgi:2-succinyl-6-hydroxy-2,4-cyclohexadiene-1-carboxylate synthase
MKDLRIHVDNIALQVREYEREGETIVFLHYGGGNLMVWQRVVPYFQARHRLVLVDLRGHGKSDRPDTGYHIDEMAGDVAGVMENLGIERAHILGSSLGAEVGLSLAANHPRKVASLACDGALSSEYGPYGIWDGSEEAFRAYVAEFLEKTRNAPERVFDSIEAFIDARRNAFEARGWWNSYVEAAERYGVCKTDDGRYASAWRKPVSEAYMRYYFDYRFEDYYSRVECPVLMLPGEEDWRDERAKMAMEGLSQLARRAKIVAVPGWIHPYGWLLDPEGACQAVLKFLEEVDG